MKTGWQVMAERQEKIDARIRELTKGYSPYYNVGPLAELIEKAWQLGFEIASSDTP